MADVWCEITKDYKDRLAEQSTVKGERDAGMGIHVLLVENKRKPHIRSLRNSEHSLWLFININIKHTLKYSQIYNKVRTIMNIKMYTAIPFSKCL